MAKGNLPRFAEMCDRLYYTVLHSSPKFLHRFYTDASSLTLAEYGSDGPVETVLTQRVRDLYHTILKCKYCALLRSKFCGNGTAQVYRRQGLVATLTTCA
eukprot:1399237-Pyramimonas_sp.AAC.2